MDAAWIEAMSDLWKQDEEIDFVGLERKHRLKALERSGAETPLLAGQSAARQSLLICLTGFGDQRDEIAKIITSNGGRFTGDLTRKCTHLIASKPEGKKFTAAKSWNIYTVTLDWLYQSVERGMILDEAKFDPLLPLEQQGVGAWVKQDPRRTSLGKRSRSAVANRPEEGARKLRKTVSMKLNSQRKNLWGDILGKSTSREYSFNDGQQAEMPAQAAPHPEPIAREDEDGVFCNCVFAIHGFDQRRNNVLEETVATLGGTVAPTLEGVASSSVRGEPWHRFLIVPQTSQPDTHPRMLNDDVHIVTEFYVERCMHNKRFSPPSEHVLGRPFPLFPIAGFSKLIVCSAAFTGLELSQVARSVAQLGATFEEEFRRSTSLVVCKSLQAMRKEKLRYALEWGVPVVSADWLWECISTGFNVPFDAYIFPEIRKQYTSGQLGEAEEKGSSKPQQRRQSGPKLAFPGLGKARPPSEAGLDATAFDRDSPNRGGRRNAEASRGVPHEDSTTSADFMTARTHHADTFYEDSGAPLGKASRARLDKSPSPPKHAAGPMRTRSEPWPRSLVEKPTGPVRGPSAPPADASGEDGRATSEEARRNAAEQARKQAREAERQVLSSKLSSLIQSTTADTDGRDSRSQTAAARPRRRQVFGRAISNASNASSATSAEAGRPAPESLRSVAGGGSDDDDGAAEAGRAASRTPPPPPATQLEYRDPQVLESKAALVSKMMMVASGDADGAGAAARAAPAATSRAAGAGIGVYPGRALRKR